MMRIAAASALCALTFATSTTVAATVSDSSAIKTAVLAQDQKSVRLSFKHKRSVSVEADDPGQTFGAPRIAANRHRAGWLTLRADGGSYETPVGVAIYADGRRHDVGCDGGAPLAWRFEPHGRIAVKCAFPHGAVSTSLQLFDVLTGKLLGRVDLNGDDGVAPVTVPGWARGAFVQ